MMLFCVVFYLIPKNPQFKIAHLLPVKGKWLHYRSLQEVCHGEH